MDYKRLYGKKKQKIENPFLKMGKVNKDKSQQITNLEENLKDENVDKKFDENLIGKMFLIRFKIMNFVNNAHDLICNQVIFVFFKEIYKI